MNFNFNHIPINILQTPFLISETLFRNLPFEKLAQDELNKTQNMLTGKVK